MVFAFTLAELLAPPIYTAQMLALPPDEALEEIFLMVLFAIVTAVDEPGKMIPPEPAVALTLATYCTVLPVIMVPASLFTLMPLKPMVPDAAPIVFWVITVPLCKAIGPFIAIPY